MRSEQSLIDSWAKPFEQEFGKDSRFAIYEVPMINAAWKVFSWMIDLGITHIRKRIEFFLPSAD